MAKDYSKKMKESALIQQTEEYMDNEVFGEQGRVEDPLPSSPIKGGGKAATEDAPELTKGVSVPIPISQYDHLDAMKKRSQRTGNRLDRKTITELIQTAVKEFCERNPL